MKYTPATLTVRRDQYTHGVVILNEVEPPDPDDQETYSFPPGHAFLKGKPQVRIDKGGDWPKTITVALFKDLNESV